MRNNQIKIKPFGNQERFNDNVSIDSKKTCEIDFSAWAEENHDVTSIDWEVTQGQATISGESLVSNISTALISFAQAGRVQIKVTATTSAEVYVAWIDILVKDLSARPWGDYWGWR